MNRFSSTALAGALIAMFARRTETPITRYRPARFTRPRDESVRRIAAAQAKRERRRLRPCGSST